MRTLAIVPARCGSKGIPGKNTRDFAGKPLFAWAVEIGKATCNHTVVTTDDAKTGEMARRYGAEVVYSDVHGDETPMLVVVQDTLKRVDSPFDVVVLLQPTQPFRTVVHVREACWALSEAAADSIVSVVEIPAHYSPDFALEIDPDGGLCRWIDEAVLDGCPSRRQDCRPAYTRDGTVYVARREIVEAGSLYGDNCYAYIVPADESVNLDTEEDWQLAMTKKEISGYEVKRHAH